MDRKAEEAFRTEGQPEGNRGTDSGKHGRTGSMDNRRNTGGQETGQTGKPETRTTGEPEVRQAGKPEGQSTDRKRRRTVAVLAACAAICALVTGYLLFDYHRTGVEADKALEALRLEGQALSRETPGSGRTAETAVEAVMEAIVGTQSILGIPAAVSPYAEVFRDYPDIKGWLLVEGTAIDYPILQREGDDEYYLYRDFKGEEDKRGSLLLDEGSSVEEGEFTTSLLVHGHNMKDGSMFGGLDEYRSEDYYKEHTHMTLYARDGVHEYEVISVFESQVYYALDQVFKYYNFFQADTVEEFHYFYDNIKKLSLYDTGVTAEYGDRFLTLSTCAYHVEDGRFVVVAKEMD